MPVTSSFLRPNLERSQQCAASSLPLTNCPDKYSIGILEWHKEDGIADVIRCELTRLGQSTIPFQLGNPTPQNIDILITYGPYGKTLPVWQQAAKLGPNRPIVVHWNTEGIPDIRVPRQIMKILGNARSSIGQLEHSRFKLLRQFASTNAMKLIDQSTHRWRYWGDYHNAYRQKWLHLLADSSSVYCQLRADSGIPTSYVPWGGIPEWYANMNLERDIDVLWLGKRGSSRRSKILDQVVGKLRSLGVKVHVADDLESPFIFDEERTEYLNRAKITLNITRTWYDDNFSRFAMAAPNRSLIVSEDMLPHCPEYIANVHYVSASVPNLSSTIMHYLENDTARQAIVESAYQLTTLELNFSNSMRKLLTEISMYRHRHAIP